MMTTEQQWQQEIDDELAKISLKKSTAFVRFANDGEARVLLIEQPYFGFEKIMPKGRFNPKPELKPHFYVTVLGSNVKGENVEVTYKELKERKNTKQKSWTVGSNLKESVLKKIKKNAFCLYVCRNGVADSNDTTYEVMEASRLDDEEWKTFLPKISREELTKLNKEHFNYEENKKTTALVREKMAAEAKAFLENTTNTNDEASRISLG